MDIAVTERLRWRPTLQAPPCCTLLSPQDRRLAEENQRGINSKAYQPGPYSKTYEFGVINFIDWYSERLLNNLGEEAPAAHLRQVSGD